MVVTKDKNKNKAKRPADDRRNETATAAVPSKPPSIRDTRADTESTHSYSAAATTAASKEPREFLAVPQTVSVITRQQKVDQNSTPPGQRWRLRLEYNSSPITPTRGNIIHAATP